MEGLKKAIEEKRIIFFYGGRYKYVPSQEYLHLKKPFNSERANKMHDLKLSNKIVYQQVDKKLEKIELNVEKGLKRITNGYLKF